MKTTLKYLSIIMVLALIVCTGTACKKAKATREWKTSGHADTTSEAFTHWVDNADPNAVVDPECASCHSTSGFQQYMADGNREVANPPLATENDGITCDACHTNTRRGTLREPPTAGAVTFSASGEQATGLADTSAIVCGQCHQGRTYYGSVDDAIAAVVPVDNDTYADVIYDNLTSVSPHYRAAFAAIKASKSKIGYVYGLNALHVDRVHLGGTDCIVCHNQHTSQLDVGRDGKNCATAGCHVTVTSADDILALNTVIPGGETGLLNTIRDYAADNTTLDAEGNTKAKACIAYDDTVYPYWFNDANCDGTAEDTSYGNQYKSFTPRLLKACYNYMISKKDPGGFAHNQTYMVAIMAASVTNLRLYNADLGK